jgi:hypothetical protein
MALNPGGGNGFPSALIDIFEQKNFLERKIRKSLLPTYVFRPTKIDPKDWFDANIGETKTFTRRALIAPNTKPLDPAQNTGLDNGMTADARSFEQWTAKLNRWPGFIPTFITGQETLIADLYLDNIYALGQKAGNSLELVCAERIWEAYDSGDSFITAGVTGTQVAVDNCHGFITQFSAVDLPNLGSPQPVTSQNQLAVAIVSGSTGFITYLCYVTNYALDTVSASYMQNGGIQFGRSGVLTLSESVTVSAGDRIVAIDTSAITGPATNKPAVGQTLNPVWKDGSYVVRPLNEGGQMITTAYALTDTNIMAPSAMIPYAVSRVKRRGIPKLSNGLYGCAIDSQLLAQFYQDDGFLKATATRWHSSPVFQNGVIAAGWGVEFTEATQVPTYPSPNGQFQLAHAFVFGEECITEHPFKGVKDATAIVAGVGDVADTRFTDRIKFRTLAAIDTLGDVIKLAYDYQGDFVPGTDKSSNPYVIQQSDYMRYKRGVMLQAVVPF